MEHTSQPGSCKRWSRIFWIAVAVWHIPAWASFIGAGWPTPTPMTHSFLLAAMLPVADRLDLLGNIELNAGLSMLGRNLRHLASGIAATLLGPCAIILVNACAVLGVLLLAQREKFAAGRPPGRAHLTAAGAARGPR
jgi:hypothetical protein